MGKLFAVERIKDVRFVKIDNRGEPCRNILRVSLYGSKTRELFWTLNYNNFSIGENFKHWLEQLYHGRADQPKLIVYEIKEREKLPRMLLFKELGSWAETRKEIILELKKGNGKARLKLIDRRDYWMNKLLFLSQRKWTNPFKGWRRVA